MTRSPKAGLFIPKKAIDQKPFRKSWTTNRMMAFFTSVLPRPLSQINATDQPIRMYSSVHIGPKIQLGGLKKGLFSPAYQPVRLFAVAIPEILPIAKQSMAAIRIFIGKLKSFIL